MTRSLSLIAIILSLSGAQGQGSTTTTTTTTLTSTTAIPQNCTWGKNTLGTCDCQPQLFVENTCKRAFYCTEVPDTVENGADYDGCAVECQDDEILIADPRDGGSFYCLTKIGPMPMLCPGGFNTNCGCSGSDAECPIGECQCQGQLRVNNDCTYARKCNSDAPNGYEEYNCTDGQIVHVNLVNFKVSCGEDDNRCPGAFHVGCDQPATTTTSTTSTTTTTTSTNPSTDNDSTTTTTTTTTTTSTTSTTSTASSSEKRVFLVAVSILILCVSQMI